MIDFVISAVRPSAMNSKERLNYQGCSHKNMDAIVLFDKGEIDIKGFLSRSVSQTYDF